MTSELVSPADRSPGSETRVFEELHVAMREGLALAVQPDSDIIINSPLGTLVLKRPSAGLSAVLNALANGGATINDLGNLVLELDGGNLLHRFYYHLEQLQRRGMLQHTVVSNGMPLMTIMGIGPRYGFEPLGLRRDEPYLLSRFACCRRHDRDMLLESPAGHAQIVLYDWRAAALVAMLAEPVSIQDLAGRLPDVNEHDVAGCFQLLLNANMLSKTSADGSSMEDDDPRLAQWSFHDLLFHSRSRIGRHSSPFGGNFRHIGRIAPLPAVKPPPEGEKIDLDRPYLDQLRASDAPLTQVMETRKSVYCYGEQPITLAQLGEFLYRVARVRSIDELPVLDQSGGVRATMPVSSRPYPAGGKCYELEFYITANHCAGLTSGMYHYDPLDHRLTRLRGRDKHVEALVRYYSYVGNVDPQVVVTLAARFQRVSWKYDAIAYATTLKHVGVVYQTMYLVATAMNLGPTALGSGDSDAFAAAAGTDYFAETSVGEFLLGSLPAAGTGAHGVVANAPG